MAARGRAIEFWHARVDEAEQAEFATFERVDGERVCLRDFAGGINFVVERDQNAFADRRGICGNSYGVEQINRAVRTYRRGGTHCPRQYNRFVAVNRQVQEIRGLLNRVGAVRDDNAVNVAGKQFVDSRRKLEPNFVGDVLAVD